MFHEDKIKFSRRLFCPSSMDVDRFEARRDLTQKKSTPMGVVISGAAQVDIVVRPVRVLMSCSNADAKGQAMRNRISITAALFASLLLLARVPSPGGSQNQPQASPQGKGNVVYVCACLKTKSCSCMTEAKTEGPCACGTQGGPPLKAVPRDSSWAKENRDALAK